MATATKGFGTLVQRETSEGSGTWTTIPGAKDIDCPGLDTEMLDSTDMEATSGIRQRIGGLKSVGDVSFTINYDQSDAVHEQLEQDWLADTDRTYRVVRSDAGDRVMAFRALPTLPSATSPVAGLNETRVVLKYMRAIALS